MTRRKTKEPTGEDVAGLHLDIAPGGEGMFGGTYPPYLTIQDGADCDLAFADTKDIRDLAASLLRAADVLDAHLAQEAK